MDQLVEVKVLIPASRVGRFYEVTSRFLARDDDYEVRAHPVDRVGPEYKSWAENQLASWEKGTPEERLNDARRFYRGVSINARRFLDYLLQNDSATRSAEEAAAKLGLGSTRQLAGALNTFGKQRRLIGRYQPFRMERATDGSTTYLVPEPIADLFREALGQSKAGTQS